MKILLFTLFLLVTMGAHASSTRPYSQDTTSLSTSDITSDVSLNQRYDTVSASAATLMVPSCNSGASAQAEGGGIGLSQRSPSCVNIDGMNGAMRLADFFRRQAKQCPDDIAKQKELHDLAHMAIDDAVYYQGLQKELAGDRAKTGWVAAWFKDTILPIAAVIGLVLIL